MRVAWCCVLLAPFSLQPCLRGRVSKMRAWCWAASRQRQTPPMNAAVRTTCQKTTIQAEGGAWRGSLGLKNQASPCNSHHATFKWQNGRTHLFFKGTTFIHEELVRRHPNINAMRRPAVQGQSKPLSIKEPHYFDRVELTSFNSYTQLADRSPRSVQNLTL